MFKTFSAGLLGSNTYVVYDEKEAMIVDCGNPVQNIRAFCLDEGLFVKYIVLTHSHYDHIEFVDQYKQAFPEAKVVCHKDEVKLLSDPEANVSLYFGAPKSYALPDVTVKEGDTLEVGTMSFKVLFTPGHTPGSMCLYDRTNRLMLTGDTLFERGYGRCDFKYGSEADLFSSLRRLLSMDPDTTFLSGHGAASTIGREKY